MKFRSILIIAAILQAFIGLNAAVVDTISIESRFLSSPEKVIVVTPQTNPQRPQYPTVYLLNGFGGDHTSWMKVRPDLPRLADELGLILVMPDGRDSWYWDAPADPSMQMESFFINDLVPYIDRFYPTVQHPTMRAITGLSMGGQGAMYLAMRHPYIWGNAGSTSGGLDIRPFPEKWKMRDRLGDYASHQSIWDEHSPVVMAQKLEPGMINIIFDCGADDFFAQVNEAFHLTLAEKKIPHDYIQRPGNHSAAYWNNSIPYQLHYFSTKFYPQTPPAK